MVVELRKSFTNYDPNKHRNCNWVVSHLRITDFYDFYDETNNPIVLKSSNNILLPLSFFLFLIKPNGLPTVIFHE